jgi:hypothetical protein
MFDDHSMKLGRKEPREQIVTAIHGVDQSIG